MECSDGCGWEPPPDTILVIPPPPLPLFLSLPANASIDPCLDGPPATELCPVPKPGFHFVELSHHSIDDTWLLVLVSCSVGALLLGSLLALILLKCREHSESKEEEAKSSVPRMGCDPVLYAAPSRVLWATLTPAGTTHHTFCCPNNNNSIDNNNFPRLDSYYVDGEPVYSEPDEYLMKVRPRVSSPTRIEHPNLPPLNLLCSRTFPRFQELVFKTDKQTILPKQSSHL